MACFVCDCLDSLYNNKLKDLCACPIQRRKHFMKDTFFTIYYLCSAQDFENRRKIKKYVLWLRIFACAYYYNEVPKNRNRYKDSTFGYKIEIRGDIHADHLRNDKKAPRNLNFQ
ncbi:uncharacterized protein LOC128868806 [Anastrepha ludens]|uniref:uncharacterized protein LOC128868806 n=1 Tax=Anastrepha ludens TaxID=28586 RepID=UPI0023AED138|nr:uncharacterized protein LOC128868806 [Anastrepha ludens]